LTQKTAVHASHLNCVPFNVATGIVSSFSDFDVSETGTGMPCYCIQWNVSDKNSGAMFCAELEEVRSSHDPLTATATHQLHFVLQDKNGVVLQESRQNIGQLIPTANFTHPFGTPFQDTVAFYMSVFNDPANNPALWHKIITFFWYNFVGGGTPANPHPAEIIGTGNTLIPNWFTPTDLSLEFVAIDGDVQFSKELSALGELGEQPHTAAPAVAAVTYPPTTPPCVSQFGKETSNAQAIEMVVSNDDARLQHSVGFRFVTALPSPPPPPPPPPPVPTNVVSVSAKVASPPPLVHSQYLQLQAIVKAQIGTSGKRLLVDWFIDNIKMGTSTTGGGDLPNLGVAYYGGTAPAVGAHTAYAMCGTVKSAVVNFTTV
jgi:hypothetical protein